MSWQQLLLVAAPALPLGMCLAMLAPPLRPLVARLLPVAPLPALAAALWLPEGIGQPLPLTLIGGGLGLTAGGRQFLGIAALLWVLAAIHARVSVRERPRRFAGWWLATLGGNLLLFVAVDAATFYLAFALLSLGAFGLVVHHGSAEALRAGRVYLVLAILGETCLLLGLLLAVDAAGTTLLAELPQAISAAPQRDLMLAMLLAGFGIKAGLMPLHVWLPLAHPAAPVAASAVLSGAIVKAGIYGLTVYLPLGAGVPHWSGVLVTLGLLTALLGVVFGVAQQRPKTVLAYSTLSQMGLITAVLGAGMEKGSAAPFIAAAGLYAAHHSLAKGALFLSVGVLSGSGGRSRRLVLLLAVLAALSIAGLPLVGGALAKLALKGTLQDEVLVLLVALSGTATTLVMLRFLQLARRIAAQGEASASRSEVLPFVVLAVLAAVLPWLWFAGAAGVPMAYGLAPANLWATFWPMMLGVVVFVSAARVLPRSWHGCIPEGDLIVPASSSARRMLAWASRLPRVRLRLRASGLMPSLRTDRAEQWLGRWQVAGLLLLGLIGLLVAVR